MKKDDAFHIIAQNRDRGVHVRTASAVLTSTNNLCFRANKRKMYTPYFAI